MNEPDWDTIAGQEIKSRRDAISHDCGWPYGHCEPCARVWGLTAVHMTYDGTCAMYGHQKGDLT